MSIHLPEAFYRPAEPTAPARRASAWIALAIAVLSGWQVFALPGAPIWKQSPPADMPWYGFGLVGVFVEADGRWVIHREGYADRMRKYVIVPKGTLVPYEESGTYEGVDASGARAYGTQMPGGGILNVKPSQYYYGWLKDLREGNERPTGTPAASRYPLPSYTGTSAAPPLQPYVIVRVYKHDHQWEFAILDGYHYYPVFDAARYKDPYLWITTNQARFLHVVYVSDRQPVPEVRVLKTVPLQLGMRVLNDTVLGVDPVSGRLFLLLATGERFWFDPLSLKQLKHERLPGVWEREYAAITRIRFLRGTDRGWPLTKGQYVSLMRITMVVFLGSLLWLATRWRQAWRFIAAPTTVDTS